MLNQKGSGIPPCKWFQGYSFCDTCNTKGILIEGDFSHHGSPRPTLASREGYWLVRASDHAPTFSSSAFVWDVSKGRRLLGSACDGGLRKRIPRGSHFGVHLESRAHPKGTDFMLISFSLPPRGFLSKLGTAAAFR